MAGFVTQALVESIAHSIDITKLSGEAAKALAPDVEYKLRELVQDAQKFARHAGRIKLTTEDVNNALRMRNTEPLYGFSNKDPAKYVKAVGHADVYCLEDPEIPVEKLIEQPLPRTPMEVGLMPHWLFIEGVQPLTPENTPMERPPGKRARQPAATVPSVPPAGKAQAAAQGTVVVSEDGKTVQVQLPVQHVLSLELQSYFTRAMAVIHAAVAAAKVPSKAQPGSSAAAGQPAAAAGAAGPAAAAAGAAGAPAAAASGPAAQQGTQHWGQMAAASDPTGTGAGATAAGQAVDSNGQAALGTSSNVTLEAVLGSLSTDPGLHPLVPYLIKYIADEVSSSLPHAAALLLLLRLARALLRNQDLKLRDYVHQLLPALLTCVVAKGIGSGSVPHAGSADAWAVRQAAAQVVAEVCARFGDVALNVQPRVTKTLLLALLDTSKPLTAHYGAVVGLAALGPASVRLLLLPQVPAYMERLQPLLAENTSTEQQPGDMMDVDGSNGAGTGAAPASGADQAMRAARHADAVRVHGALVDAAATALYRLMVDKVAAGFTADDGADEAAARTSAAALAKVALAFRPQAPSIGARTVGLTTTGGDTDMWGPQEPDNDRARACATLAMSWREDVALADVAWAAGELLGPALVARLPQARPAHQCL